MSYKNYKAGFTLIELLVVISIIGLLSSVVIASVAVARNKAKALKAQSDMATFGKIVSFAQGESGKTLYIMSANGGAAIPNCSSCVAQCASPNVLSNVPSSNPCYDAWSKILIGVKMNAGNLGDNLSAMNRDPWGSPYLVDQNQGEISCTTLDTIMSVGPDGIVSTADDVIFNGRLPLSATCP